MSQIDNLKEDTKIPIFEELKSLEFSEKETGETPIFEYTILSSEHKIDIFENIAIATANGYQFPLIVLAPMTYLSKRPSHLTYPLAFQKSYLFFIPYIKKVIVLESK